MASLIRLSLCLLVFSAVSLMPVAAQASDRDRIKAFLDVTGFDVALKSIGLSARHAPLMLGMEASDFGTAWSRLSDRIFDPQLLQEMAIEMLEETLSDDLLAHAAGFYASELGQRLVEVENASHLHPDDDLKRREGEVLVEAYGSGPGSRTALLDEMNDAVDGTGQALRAVQEVQLRFLLAASDAGVLGYEIDEAALRAFLREDEDDLHDRLRLSGLYHAAYTYQTLSDADLRAYRDALSTPEMQRVYELMNAVQHEIRINRYEALAAALAGLTGGEEL